MCYFSGVSRWTALVNQGTGTVTLIYRDDILNVKISGGWCSSLGPRGYSRIRAHEDRHLLDLPIHQILIRYCDTKGGLRARAHLFLS